MGFTGSSLLYVALVFAFCSSINGLDITKVLGKYPEYTQFNKYLTETKLAEQINSRNAVTILALNDAAMATLSGKTQDAAKAIVSTHVLVDFYDEKKLMEAEGSHTKVETLFQSSGAAKNDQGYIYVALINEGEIAFGSAAAAPGAPFDVMLVRSVTNEANVVSVLQVTKPIVAPGIELPSFENSLAKNTANKDAQSPAALAPAPSSAGASPVCMGLLAAASAFASFFMFAL